MQNLGLLVGRECYKRCSSLVQYFGRADLGFAAPRICLLMEFMPQTIESLLDPRSFWRLATPPAAAPWLLAIAEGLKVLHDQSWAHGSLTPGKVLTSSDGTVVKLGDFGMRYIVAERRDRESSKTGAPSAGGTSELVKAPGVWEIECEEDEPDFSADIIAFGRMMAYLEHRKCPGTDTKDYQDLKNLCLDAAGGSPLSIDGVLKILHSFDVSSSKEMVETEGSGSCEKGGQDQNS
ncbi:hypothetical protein KFL_000040343 [Klebsormidium nitens]|uniref:Protein kinase domain-containing protein n=1 Tax=Klebsormidium nitens TaxID=105231 RepID=A0A1Y1HIW4_KLENI|nr:hypothetical protein KFL_000040343 [Klebsormidium nitens]|eukprot:GAQ77833.1 hypothetical protein KFL_000040343 [Klebsormidium nitens]